MSSKSIMNNYLLVIAYDGSGFNGWQMQDSKSRTVQGSITAAIEAIFKCKVVLNGSGRTDAGAHAYGQTASFKMNVSIKAEKLKNILNVSLPSDISIIEAYNVDNSFHARYDAVGKSYIYKLRNGSEPSPFDSRYCYFLPYSRMRLDIFKMKQASNLFIGTHDFKGFMATGSPKKTTVRTITKLEIDSQQLSDSGDRGIVVTINGSGFLYKMVRIIVGTLIDIGVGKIKEDEILVHLNEGVIDRKKPVAPAAGLYLADVYYDLQ